MNEIIKNMLTRVSVRKFTAERVEDEKLKTIVECAKASPTGKNRQMRKFTVVHNREKIQELAKAVSSVLDIPNYRIYDCDALILISFEEDDRFVKQPAKKNKKNEEYTTKNNYTLCNYSYIMCNV